MRLLERLRRRPRPIDLGSPAVASNPFPVYEVLRKQGPVRFLPGHDFWLVLSYEAVKQALDRPDLFSNAPYRDIDAVLLAADPPRHTVVRRLVGRHFSADTIARVERAAAAEAAARLAPEIDSVGGYSVPVSRAAAAELLGFDAAAAAAVAEAVEAAKARPEPVPALVDALDRLADRAALFHSLAAESAGTLGDSELRSLIRLLWLAATTTTERVISRSILGLLRQPALRTTLAADGTLIGPYIEEVMRLFPPELMVPRRATEATSLAGCGIEAGAEVRLCLAAANRDSAAFPDPAELRLDRGPGHHLAFGGGVHRCLGAALARRVATAGLAALLDGAPGLRAAEPLDRIDWFASVTALAPARLLVATR
jgi:cytochrome P450